MQQAVDPAQVDKGPVFGDVLHHALNQLTFLQIGQRRLGAPIAGFFQQHPARDHHVAPPVVDLDDFQRKRFSDQPVRIRERDEDRSVSLAETP